LAPEPDAFGEGVEGWEAGVLDRDEESLEPALCVGAAARPVDRPERFLDSPRLGEDWVAREQLAKALSLSGA
jgi:hypothetical protein